MNLMSFSKIIDTTWIGAYQTSLPQIVLQSTRRILSQSYYKQDYYNSLPLIKMDQGPYFKDPRIWKFNVYIRCLEEAVHGPCQTVRDRVLKKPGLKKKKKKTLNIRCNGRMRKVFSRAKCTSWIGFSFLFTLLWWTQINHGLAFVLSYYFSRKCLHIFIQHHDVIAM
jgi:hypothetical protein